MIRRRFVWSAACLTLAAAGCGPKTHNVSGQIVFPDNTPVTGLAGGGVLFDLVGGKYTVVSPIDAEGRFKLYAIKPGDGIRPGTYRVTIGPPMPSFASLEPGQKPPPAPVNPIDGKYSTASTSGLEVLVDRSMDDLKLTVEPAGKKK